jgi:four helix bundle protein
MVESSGNDRGRRVPRVVRLALAFVRYCDGVERELGGRKAGLNRHLQEAAASVVANAGEALEEPNRGDKRRFFRYAMRSAGECEHLLRALGEVDALAEARLEEGLRLLRDIRQDLLRLLRWAA